MMTVDYAPFIEGKEGFALQVCALLCADECAEHEASQGLSIVKALLKAERDLDQVLAIPIEALGPETTRTPLLLIREWSEKGKGYFWHSSSRPLLSEEIIFIFGWKQRGKVKDQVALRWSDVAFLFDSNTLKEITMSGWEKFVNLPPCRLAFRPKQVNTFKHASDSVRKSMYFKLRKFQFLCGLFTNDFAKSADIFLQNRREPNANARLEIMRTFELEAGEVIEDLLRAIRYQAKEYGTSADLWEFLCAPEFQNWTSELAEALVENDKFWGTIFSPPGTNSYHPVPHFSSVAKIAYSPRHNEAIRKYLVRELIESPSSEKLLQVLRGLEEVGIVLPEGKEITAQRIIDALREQGTQIPKNCFTLDAAHRTMISIAEVAYDTCVLQRKWGEAVDIYEYWHPANASDIEVVRARRILTH